VPFAAVRGRPVAGFYARGSHRIVDLEECAIQHPLLVRLLCSTREHALRAGVEIYDEVRHRGVLRALVARLGMGTGALLVGLVVRVPGDARVARLAARLAGEFRDRGLTGVLENHNPRVTNVVLGERSAVLHGNGLLEEEFEGLAVSTTLGSFSQSNHEQAAVLYSEALRLLGEPRELRVVDLYSGWGPLALRLAARGARVVAVERNAEAVRAGEDNARRNGLASRLRFLALDVEAGLAACEEPDAVIVDPPRKGLARGCKRALVECGAATLVYVSCNPDTLLRDLVDLAPRYRTTELVPVDLFPRTEHLECVARLERR
jgi:23S rRNA (uracil1939-C5)-methyltransferase